VDDRTDPLDGTRQPVFGPHPAWGEIDDLIRSGDYDQLEQVLKAHRDAGIDVGDTMRAAVLDAAQQLCHACGRLHREQDDHYQAIQRLALLEEDTLRRVEHLLVPLWAAQPTEPDPAMLPLASEPVTWRLALRRWMARAFGPPQAPLPPPDRMAAAPSPHEAPPVAPPALPPAEVLSSVAPPSFNIYSFNIYCLGAFRVYHDEVLISNWPSRKGRSILQYLLLNRAVPVSKDVLMETFWPGGDPADTRRNLHQAIYSLRQSLRRHQSDLQPILFNQDTYSLNPAMTTWLDFEEFEKHAHGGRRHEAAGRPDKAMEAYSVAVSFYQGDFLEEDLYEDWPTTPRDNMRNLFITIANRLGEYYREQAEHTAAIALSQVILTKDNCNEEAHRRLMRCYTAMGQRHLATRQYLSCVQALRVELDLAPSEETTELHRQLK